jgi:transposase
MQTASAARPRHHCRALRRGERALVRQAVTFKSAVDDPSRITKSKAVGVLFGLTPKKYQSGEKDVTGGITRAGDEMVRTALYEAANVLLSRITRFSKLKRWGMDVAKRRGSKPAKIALARKIAVILHRKEEYETQAGRTEAPGSVQTLSHFRFG